MLGLLFDPGVGADTVHSSETSVSVCQITSLLIPEDSTLHN
jgi:hypothetical protein